MGAGPGDPELITLKAVRILENAKAILYDSLANEELLQYASPGTVIKFVGKRSGCHSFRQEEINSIIIDFVNKYGYVVRLKGATHSCSDGLGKKLKQPKAAASG